MESSKDFFNQLRAIEANKKDSKQIHKNYEYIRDFTESK
jgi:hypothetical protein